RTMARLPRQQLSTDGACVDASAGDAFESVNRAHGEVLAEVAQAPRADPERAVNRAEKGQKVWASMTGKERSRVMRKAVDLLRERNDEVAMLEPLDTGKPLMETRSVDIRSEEHTSELQSREDHVC